MTYDISDFQRIWVRGRFIDMVRAAREDVNYGLPGSVQFIPQITTAIDGDNDLILGMGTFVAYPATDDGYFAINLPATDDPDINPEDWKYKVIEPTGREYLINVPYDTPVLASIGDPLDGQRVLELADVVPDPDNPGGVVQTVVGPQGRGIDSVDVDEDGHLIVAWDDDFPDHDAGYVVGPTGATGATGPAGPALQLQSPAVANYAALPGGLGSGDAGKAWLVTADGKVYVWSGSAFPTDGNGLQWVGPAGADGEDGEDGSGGISLVVKELDVSAAIFRSTAFPALVQANGTNYPVRGLAYDAATDEAAFWTFIANNYSTGNLTVDLYWYADSASTNAVVWGAQIACITATTDSQDIETDGLATAVTTTTTHAGTTGQRLHKTTIALSNLDSIAAGDFCEIRIYRDADNGSDTMTGDAILVKGLVTYTAA